MSTFARITQNGVFDTIVELTAEEFDALQANGKAIWLRVWVVDTQPTPTATQVVISAGIVITPTEARQTWGLREKTQAELDAETNAADRPLLLQMLSSITNDIDSYNANPDVTGTAVERITKLEVRVKELERQQRRDNRILRYYLRGQQ